MTLRNYKEYLRTLFYYTIEGIPDDEVCISIKEIYHYCKKASDYAKGIPNYDEP